MVKCQRRIYSKVLPLLRYSTKLVIIWLISKSGMLKKYKKYGGKVEIVPIKCSKSTILILVLKFLHVYFQDLMF